MQGFKGLQQRTAEMASAEKRNLMGDWAELCQDLLILIAKRIHQYEDLVAFDGVCRSWRCLAIKKNFDLSVQIPWLMLSKEEVAGSHQPFVSLSNGGMVRRVFLPEARGKDLHSSMGWLISKQYNKMELLHPLTGRQIPLGELKGRHCSDSCLHLDQAVLSASPSFRDDYVVMVITASRLYFWKPRNNVWNKVGFSGKWYDIVYYKDQFYAINTAFSLFLCDTKSGSTHVVGHASPGMLSNNARAAYLVKSSNELLLVLREGFGGDNTVRVFKYCNSADMMNVKWQEVYNLGGESIFVGRTAATAVPVNAAAEIKPNCIYFSWNMKIYNLESRTIEPMPEVSSPYCSSTWVIPSF